MSNKFRIIIPTHCNLGLSILGEESYTYFKKSHLHLLHCDLGHFETDLSLDGIVHKSTQFLWRKKFAKREIIRTVDQTLLSNGMENKTHVINNHSSIRIIIPDIFIKGNGGVNHFYKKFANELGATMFNFSENPLINGRSKDLLTLVYSKY